MIVIQTALDRKAMTALARAKRKTLRRGRSAPVRMLAWFVAAVELFLVYAYLRAGQSGWQINALLAAIMLASILTEDLVSGITSLRRIPPEQRTVNTAFQEDSYYVNRTQAGEDWRLYSQIKLAAEDKDYFFLLQDRTHGQVYDKKGFSWGAPEEFRELIHKKTGLQVRQIGGPI